MSCFFIMVGTNTSGCRRSLVTETEDYLPRLHIVQLSTLTDTLLGKGP